MRVVIKDINGEENVVDDVRKVIISTVTDGLMSFYSSNTDLIHINENNIQFFTIVLKKEKPED